MTFEEWWEKEGRFTAERPSDKIIAGIAFSIAYDEGLKRAEELARANAHRWIDPETVCNDIADEIAEERTKREEPR